MRMWRMGTAGVRRRRRSAVGAAVTAGAGSVGLAFAVVGQSDLRGFVSESGVDGAPSAAMYRISVVTLAVACGLLAFALRPVAGAAALALGASAPFTGVSGAVTCTPGCPLPPYERSTPADIIHAGASIFALSLSTLAMLVLAWSAEASALRRVSRFSLALTLPLLVAAAFAIFGLGRGWVAGLTERAGLFSTLGWLVLTATVQARG
jgi:Protein of unknown function (DUF998)